MYSAESAKVDQGQWGMDMFLHLQMYIVYFSVISILQASTGEHILIVDYNIYVYICIVDCMWEESLA